MEPISDTHTPTTTSGKSPGPRRITSRRAIPQGRALVGALLITLSAVGTYALATRRDTGPDQHYVVLMVDVDDGATIRPGDVAMMAMTLAPDVAAGALLGSDGIDGATALRALRAGTILDRRDLRPAAVIAGAPVVDVHELTLPIRRDRAPRSLVPGDRVTILAYDEVDGVLRTALEDALVLVYDTDSDGIGSSDGGRLTIALPDADLVVEATLRSYDSLTVVLTSHALDDVYVSAAGEDAT